ncbi:MAG TPA: chemotaxis protein CheW [Arenicellales bacterium]|nr:chemotaxis protein CheW [Arenicellales bacterium]
MTEEEPAGGDFPASGGGAPPDSADLDQAAERPVSRLVFPVAGHGLLLDSTSPMEFLEGQWPYYVPNNHPLFQGLINRRGTLVPVYEVRGLLDPDLAGQRESNILVLGSGDDAVGIFLDGTPYRIAVIGERPGSPPVKLAQVFGEHLGDSLEHEGQCYARVDLEDFLLGLVRDSH